MWIDKGEVVRVRVESDEFYDDEPGPIKMADGVQVVKIQARAPFTVTVRSLGSYKRMRAYFYSVLDGGTGSGSYLMVECGSNRRGRGRGRRCNGRGIIAVSFSCCILRYLTVFYPDLDHLVFLLTFH